MKKAFQKDQALLADIRQARSASSARLWWLGQSGFLIVREGQGILIDPYLSDSLTIKYAATDKPHVRISERVVSPEALASVGHLIAVSTSHNHTDHLDAETLLPVLKGNPQSRLIIPEANRAFVLDRLGHELEPRLILLDDARSVSLDDLQITGVAAAHNEVERDEAGRCKYLGYVFRWAGLTIYHSGDTLRHEGMIPSLRALKPDIALLPINGNVPERRVAGNLDGPAAAQLARDIGAKLVIPCHYDLFEFNTASTDKFEAACDRLSQPYRVLRLGEGMDL